MASRIPKEVKKGQIDTWIAETWKVALFKSTSNCNTDGVSTYGACTDEVADTGTYAATGSTVTKSAWGAGSGYVDVTNAMLDAADNSWTTVTWGAGNAPYYAVVYNTATGQIRFVYDFAAEKVCTGGTLTIQWNAGGLVKVS